MRVVAKVVAVSLVVAARASVAVAVLTPVLAVVARRRRVTLAVVVPAKRQPSVAVLSGLPSAARRAVYGANKAGALVGAPTDGGVVSERPV